MSGATGGYILAPVRLPWILFVVAVESTAWGKVARPSRAAAPPAPAPQVALSRELAPKLNRFQEVWERCPDARLRGPATAAFRRYVAETLDQAGDKNARRRWLRGLTVIDARRLGADAGGSLVVVSTKRCALAPTPWAVSVLVAETSDPDDLVATAVPDAAESSATESGKEVPSTLYAPLDGASLLALAREGRVKKPFPAYATLEAATAAAKNLGVPVAALSLAPGAAAGPEHELRVEGDHFRWMGATAFAGVVPAPDTPFASLSVSDLTDLAGTVADLGAWRTLAAAFAAANPLGSEARRFVAAAAGSPLPEEARRALIALGKDGAVVADASPGEGVEAVDPVVGLDETLDRRIVQRLFPAWVLQKPVAAAWAERIAKAHPDAMLDGWSPATLDDDARLAAAWVGMGAERKALVERAAQRELPDSTLRRIGEVARLDRDPTVRATTAILDHAMCLRQSATTAPGRCGLYGVMLSLLSDPDARVRYAAESQVRYRAEVRGHRFSSRAEWSAILEPLPKGPADIAKTLSLVKAAGEEGTFARWARTAEGRKWIAAITASEAAGIEDLRLWALEALGPLPPPPTQAVVGIAKTRSTSGTPPEVLALAAKVNAAAPPPAVESGRQPAAVAPTVSTIDNVVDLSDSPQAAEAQKGADESLEAQKGADESPEAPLMPAPKR